MPLPELSPSSLPVSVAWIAFVASSACALPLALTEPSGGSDAAPAKPGLQSVARSQTNGQTLGDIPPNMVLVPGGTFTMGVSEKALVKWLESDNDVRNTAADYLACCYPENQQTTSDLLVDKFETSNVQYKTWLDAKNLTPDPSTFKLNWTHFKNGTAIEGIPPEQDHHPMRAISCDEARGCSLWLGKRLPTEIEWAYVATRGLKPDQAYPWGAAIGTWDPKKCANSSNSARGSQGPQSFAPGTWKEDVTVDGVFDMCGNVCEWTTSPFLALPGFQPLEIKDTKDGKTVKRTLRGSYSAEQVTVRGGSFFGNQITNNVFWRKGEMPGSRLEGVGFRCVMSALPGLDQLNDAQRLLTMLAADFKGRLDLSREAIAGQVVQYHDPESGIGRGSKHFAFTKVTSILAPLMKVERDSIEKPVLLGIMTVSTPIANPRLGPGNYGLYFKGKGESAAQKAAKEAAKKDAHGDKKDDEKKEGDKKDGDKKDEKKKGKADAKGGKAGKTDGKGGKPDPKGGAPAEGDAKEGEAKAGEKSPEELAAEKADEDAKKALEGLGANAKQVSLVDIPTDKAVILIKNEADAIVGWMEAKFVDGQPLHSTRFTYTPAGAGGGTKAASAGGGTPMLVAPHDVARLVFAVKMGTGTKFPEFDLTFDFEGGSFEPVSVP